MAHERKEKWPAYEGSLKTPIRLWVQATDKADRVPRWWTMLGNPPDHWRDFFESEHKRALLERARRWLDVFKHYGIDPTSPVSNFDLALAIAQRHEREAFAGGVVSLSQLFKHKGLKCQPTTNEAATAFAMDLADKHVPGFRLSYCELKHRGRLVDKSVEGR